MYDDNYLIRFLKARQMKVKKAAEMFIKFLDWRINNKCEEVYKTF